jgi:hypothetical protein
MAIWGPRIATINRDPFFSQGAGLERPVDPPRIFATGYSSRLTTWRSYPGLDIRLAGSGPVDATTIYPEAQLPIPLLAGAAFARDGGILFSTSR